MSVIVTPENTGIIAEALDITRERRRRLEVRREYGTAVSSDVLGAEVDFNADTVTLINSILDLSNAKRNLNYLLGRDINNEFVVKTDVTFNEGLSYEELKAKALVDNSEIIAAQYNLKLSKLDYKLAVSEYFPTLSLNGGYGFNRSVNPASFAYLRESSGINYGATVGFTIFNGNRTRIQAQNARISLESGKQQLAQELLETERELANAWQTYQNALIILKAERQNINSARANLERSRELYNLGQITSTQFREAQVNLIRSQTSISNALYTAKLAEIELLRISGQLVEEQP